MDDLFNEESVEALQSDHNASDEIARVSNPSLLFVLVAMLALCAVAAYWCAFGTINYKVTTQGVVFPFDKAQGVSATCSGAVSRVLTTHGAEVKSGDALLELRTADSTMTLTSPTEGTVLTYRAEEEQFDEGDNIVWLMPKATDETRREMLVYVSFDDLRKLQEGQQVQVTPADLQREDWGYAYGKILGIEQYPTTRDEVAGRLKLTALASFIGEGAVYEVRVLLDAGATDGTSLRWSREKSSRLTLGTGTLCNVQVITEKKRVWEVLVGRVSDAIDDMSGQ